MLPLRYSGRWRVAGVIVLCIVFIGTMLPAAGFWPDVSFRSIVAFDKWLHACTFLFLAVWFSGQYARQSYWRIGLGLIAFGGVIELIQRSLTYRTGDLADLFANVAGITTGLLVAWAGLGGWSLRVEDWLAERQPERG